MIDCDVHNDWANADVLLPYMDPNFRDYLERGERVGGPQSFPHGHRPWLHPEDYKRQDLFAAEGLSVGADYDLMKRELLDKYDLEFAILTGEEIIDISTLANPYYASAMAKANNDYLLEHWLARDARLKGSLAVAPQDPEGAATEIRRLGHHPDIVQVMLSSGARRPYGEPFYHPIWEAASEMDLPVAIHLGGTGGVNSDSSFTMAPTFYYEHHALLCELAMSHVASLIVQGIFERWPNLSFIVMECGIAWLPAILWRLDNGYKALRKETPWLKRLPSEYARDHIRFTTQPLEQPPNKEHLWSMLEAIDGKNTLLFASDYPHWDFDDPYQVAIPKDWHDNVFDLNIRQVYKKLPQHKPNVL
ncbi:MAG: amidohydrolase family protein [Chloroflexota bacterium]